MEEKDKILHEKLFFYKDKKISIHLSKNDGRFHNGIVLEVAKDFLIIDDEKLGAMPIYFLEIKFVEPREERK